MKRKFKKLSALFIIMLFAFPQAAFAFATESIGPRIISINVSSEKIHQGQSSTFTIVTSSQARFVFVEYNHSVYAAVFQSSNISGENIWVAEVSPSSTQDVVVYANSVNVTQGASRRSVRITVDQVGVLIYDIEADKDPVPKGESVTFTITTNEKAEHVWIRLPGSLYRKAIRHSDRNDVKTWTVSFTPTEDMTIQVNANTRYSNTNAVSENYDVLLVDPPAKLTNLRANKTSLVTNESVTFTITTNVEATHVWVKYDGDKTADARNTRTTRASKTWSVTFTPSRTQTVTAYANITKTETHAATRSLDLTVNTQSVSITETKALVSGNNLGDDTLTVTVTTNGAAQYVWVEAGRDTFELNFQQTLANGNKTWSRTFTKTYYNVDFDRIVVYAAREQNGKDTSRTTTVENSGRIVNVQRIPSGHELNSTATLYIEVTTESSVSWVEVTGGHTGPGYSYTTSSSSSAGSGSSNRIWGITFPLRVFQDNNRLGMTTFTVNAYDRNDKKTDTTTFTINILSGITGVGN